jgi:hypothetical protein
VSVYLLSHGLVVFSFGFSMGNSSGKKKGGSKGPPHPLEPFTKSTGLYETCPWSDGQARNLIFAEKIAPRYEGTDARLERTEECPICFLFYRGGLNRTNCCDKGICTECFLQLKPPSSQIDCPFCNHPDFDVTWKPFDAAKQMMEDIEEQKTIEAKIHAGQRPKDFDENQDVSGMYGSPEDRKDLQKEMLRQAEEASQERTRLQSRDRLSRTSRSSSQNLNPRSDRESSLINAFRSSFGSTLTEAEIEEIMLANAIAESMRESEDGGGGGGALPEPPLDPQQSSSSQPIASRSSTSGTMYEESDSELVEGVTVRARFGGGSQFYQGTITKKREDGTFDIYYDEGDFEDFEEGVRSDLIQLVEDPLCLAGSRKHN